MEQTILVKHKQAYDTEENWKANNPILLAGQLAYSSDKYGKYKVGDGVTNWNDLEYCNEKVFTGTREEYETANKNGEIKPGTIVNITDDNDYQDINIDTELSEESENLVTNKTVTKGIKYNDTKDNTVTFTSNDTLEPPAYSDVSLLESNEKHSSIFNKISTMFKNIRYLSGLLGTQDISSIGEGTVTSAINTINTNLLKKETLLAKGHAKNVSTNLNLIKESGIYVIGDVGEYTNLPLEIAESGYCELVVFNSGIYIVQEIFTPFDTKGNIYYRFRTEREDGWKSWKAFGEIYDGYDETRKGFAADATQLNKEVEGSYAAWVAEEISGINADLANITNAEIKYLDVQKKITAVINNKICSLYINGYGSETGANFGKIDSLFAPTKDIYVPVTIVGYGSAVFRISTDGNLYLYNDDCSIYLDQKEIYGVVTYLIS